MNLDTVLICANTTARLQLASLGYVAEDVQALIDELSPTPVAEVQQVAAAEEDVLEDEVQQVAAAEAEQIAEVEVQQVAVTETEQVPEAEVQQVAP
jgi:hypothetical protein